MHIEKLYKNKYVDFFLSNKAAARQGLTLGFVYLMPDYWLEVSLHPEGTATGQLDQGFPRS
jgi:hypothetical protein